MGPLFRSKAIALCLSGGIFIAAAAPAAETALSHVIDLTPSCRAVPPGFQDWSQPLDWRSLAEWGQSRGWLLDAGSPQLRERCAVMVRRTGSSLAVTGLERQRRYRLFADFVRYTPEGELQYPSILKISAAPDNRIIATLSMEGLPKGPVAIDLPYELTLRGTILLRFTEYAIVGGLWGVRSLVIADTRDIPSRAGDAERVKPSFDPQERLVE